MPEFFSVMTPKRVFDALAGFDRLSIENATLEQALGRALGSDIVAGEDMPPRDRSTMDGFAVRAEDTFGASDAVPALLTVAGRVAMGAMPRVCVGRGQAAEIPTGGFLPEGADAVVMVEFTNRVSEGEIEVTRPVTRGQNVLGRADDVATGDRILSAGHRLRPHDIGLMAGLGIVELDVFRKPRVAVISTGDEVVSITQKPLPGQIRDVNGHAICALCLAAGAMTVHHGIIRDEPDLLREGLRRALDAADVVVLSGGSSVGERDHIVEVVRSFEESTILAHGIAISPGKPTLLARVSGKPVFGLPGHPVSALIVAQVFLVPFLKYLEGDELKRSPPGSSVKARLSSYVHSPHGREDYVRVRLFEDDGEWSAVPVFGKSGMLSTLVKADGFFVIPIHTEGMPDGQTVEVFLF